MSAPFERMVITKGRKSGCTVTKISTLGWVRGPGKLDGDTIGAVDSVTSGHWHQLYRPPWWRLISRWRHRRRYVPGTLQRYEP